MELATRVITNMEKSMAQVLSSGPTLPCLLENSIIITYMARACICGATVVSTKENGKAIKCMVKAHLLGVMADSMSVSTSMTKRMGMGNLYGLTVAATKVTGFTGNSMVKVCISPVRVRRSTASGRKENVIGGSVAIIKRCSDRRFT